MDHAKINPLFGNIPPYIVTNIISLATLINFGSEFPKILIEWKRKEVVWNSKLEKFG